MTMLRRLVWLSKLPEQNERAKNLVHFTRQLERWVAFGSSLPREQKPPYEDLVKLLPFS